MPEELKRLLQSHDFVDRALNQYGKILDPIDAGNLRRERERLFGELVRHSSPHPQVTLAQLKFLIAELANSVPDQRRAQNLLKNCLAFARRLAVEHRSEASPFVLPQEMRLLDHLTDRASVVDRNYRYLYTNQANAAFHHKSPAEIVGKSAISIVGKRRFKELTEPTMEKCFAGKTHVLEVTYESERGLITYSLNCAPVHDVSGGVVGAICIGRDISNSLIRPTVTYQVPTPAQ